MKYFRMIDDVEAPDRWFLGSPTDADGRSDWLKGLQLLAVYLVLGLTHFFLPGMASH